MKVLPVALTISREDIGESGWHTHGLPTSPSAWISPCSPIASVGLRRSRSGKQPPACEWSSGKATPRSGCLQRFYSSLSPRAPHFSFS